MDLKNYKLPIERKKEKQKKVAKYRWQDMCVEIIKLAGFDKKEAGIVWKLWTVGGYPLMEKVLGELKQGEIKKPIIYIKWLLKIWKRHR